MTSSVERKTTRLKAMISAASLAAVLACVPSALAQDAAPGETAPDTPWYEAFTLSLDENPITPNMDSTAFDWESEGGRWQITLGVQDDERNPTTLEDMSAQAYLNVGDRFRFGGGVRFTAPEDELFLGIVEPEERAPEIKFESALRF